MRFFRNNLTAKILMLLVLLTGLMCGQAAEAEIGHSARPKVIEFYASWCEPCLRLDKAMESAQSKYGADVDFVRYNVDDPASLQMVKEFEVCPIPTVVFVDQNGKVQHYSIGCTDQKVIDKGISKISPNLL